MLDNTAFSDTISPMANPIEQPRETGLTRLNAISPLDGRYRDKVEPLAPFTSEEAVIRTCMEVEGRYLVALSGIGLVRPLGAEERGQLINIGQNLTTAEVGRVKQIEETTRHDVKAMERAFREKVAGTSLEDVTEMIHFGLTSEDVNNLTYRLMLDRAKRGVIVPTLDQVTDTLTEQADRYKGLPMLGRTHGQPAVPTTYGKELAVFATRLERQTRKFESARLTGKLDGAIGNYNAHSLAVPHVDWIGFSQDFVRSLGLDPIIYTTQINPYDDMIENFQALQRANSVIIDLNQDMWRYISDGWLAQQVVKGEVGSSTMPQKVNPIDFENSEGNLVLANGMLETMGRKLGSSRLQRDLSDSTTIRNVGVALGYGELAYSSTLRGLSKVHPNAGEMQQHLANNWSILSEAAQTVMRTEGVTDPYSLAAEFAKGQQIDQTRWQQWVATLPVSDAARIRLDALTPATYTGYAEELTERAIREIRNNRL